MGQICTRRFLAKLTSLPVLAFENLNPSLGQLPPTLRQSFCFWNSNQTLFLSTAGSSTILESWSSEEGKSYSKIMHLKRKQLWFRYLTSLHCAWQSLLHIVTHGRLTEWNTDTNSLAAVKPRVNNCIVQTKDALLSGLTYILPLCFPSAFHIYPSNFCMSNHTFL